MANAEERAMRQMMADLGLSRRDTISTAEADHRGREVKRDYTALDFKYDALQRQRDKKIQAIIKSDNSSPLAAWHAAAAAADSEPGAPESRLEVKWNGQGHRLHDERGRAEHDHRETSISEERAQYLAQRANQQRERPQNGHQRALSPRAGGVARWVKGKLVQGELSTGLRTAVTLSTNNVMGHTARQSKPSAAKPPSGPVSSAGVKAAIARHIIGSRDPRTISINTVKPPMAQTKTQPSRVPQATTQLVPPSVASGLDMRASQSGAEGSLVINGTEKVTICVPKSDAPNAREDTLVFQDILNIAGVKNSSDARSILQMLFDSGRRTWLLQHPHLIDQFVAVGNAVRKEMLEVAQSEGDSQRRKSFLAEFGMIPDVMDHLAAARNAIDISKGVASAKSFLFASRDYYKPFLAMAQGLRTSKQQVRGKDPGQQSDESSIEPTYIAVARDHAATLDLDESAVIRKAKYMEPRLITLIEKNARTMLLRSGTTVDGVVKRNGIYYLAQ